MGCLVCFALLYFTFALSMVRGQAHIAYLHTQTCTCEQSVLCSDPLAAVVASLLFHKCIIIYSTLTTHSVSQSVCFQFHMWIFSFSVHFFCFFFIFKSFVHSPYLSDALPHIVYSFVRLFIRIFLSRSFVEHIIYCIQTRLRRLNVCLLELILSIGCFAVFFGLTHSYSHTHQNTATHTCSSRAHTRSVSHSCLCPMLKHCRWRYCRCCYCRQHTCTQRENDQLVNVYGRAWSLLKAIDLNGRVFTTNPIGHFKIDSTFRVNTIRFY